MTEGEGRDDIVNLNAFCIVVQSISAIMGVLKGWGCWIFRNSGHMTMLRQPSKRISALQLQLSKAGYI